MTTEIDRRRGGKMHTRPPVTLPCGCDSRAKTGRHDITILDDGARACRHGKLWRLAWIEEVRDVSSDSSKGGGK